MGWLTVQQASSATEWHRNQMREVIEFGIVPAIWLNGEVRVLAAALAGIERRLTEH